MPEKPLTKTGISRIAAAFTYSCEGISYALKTAPAFRQEIFLFFLVLPILIFLPFSPAFKAVLLLANLIILIVELLNTAIESVVDMVSPDYHVLAKHAKDLGSAAVLLSIISAILLWVLALSTL